MKDFWEGKDPCWKVLGCSKYVYPKCPAYLFRNGPAGKLPTHNVRCCWASKGIAKVARSLNFIMCPRQISVPLFPQEKTLYRIDELNFSFQTGLTQLPFAGSGGGGML